MLLLPTAFPDLPCPPRSDDDSRSWPWPDATDEFETDLPLPVMASRCRLAAARRLLFGRAAALPARGASPLARRDDVPPCPCGRRGEPTGSSSGSIVRQTQTPISPQLKLKAVETQPLLLTFKTAFRESEDFRD